MQTNKVANNGVMEKLKEKEDQMKKGLLLLKKVKAACPYRSGGIWYSLDRSCIEASCLEQEDIKKIKGIPGVKGVTYQYGTYIITI